MLGSPRFSQRLAMLGLVVAPLLFVASSALEPSYDDDARAYLAGVDRHEGRYMAWIVLFALATVFLLPGLLGVARMLRGRRGTVGIVGATSVAVSALIIAGVIVALGVTELAMVDSSADAEAMAALYDRTQDLRFGSVLFVVIWFGGFVLGTIALAVGLFLRRIVPIWSPVLLVAWIAALFFLEGRLGSLVGAIALLLAFVPLALRVWTLREEEWAAWQPLPDGATDTRRLPTSVPSASS